MAQHIKDEQVLFVDRVFGDQYGQIFPERNSPEQTWGDGEKSSTRGFNVRILDTPYGQVIAYSSVITWNRFGGSLTRTGDEETVVPGIYRGDQSSTGRGIRRMVVEHIPKDQIDSVEVILREHGYKGYVKFWFSP